jgi:glycerate kinase
MNSFKGSLDAEAACRAVCLGITSTRPDLTPQPVPLGDGGDGTLAVLAAARGGVRIRTRVIGPRVGRSVDAEWLWRAPSRLDSFPSAVIEMAEASGLRLLDPEKRNPLRTTSRGTGELVAAAVERGVRDVVLALGGSATVDGGVGAARALGWRFLSDRGAAIPAGGGGLRRLAEIVPPRVDRLADVRVRALLDVEHPLCGPFGAARVFGPQKGATSDEVSMLEEGLERLADRIHADLGLDVRSRPGGGAAGGFGAGAIAFLGAEPLSGTDFVIEAVGLEDALSGAVRVVTGEGRLDSTSLRGKAVGGVIDRAEAAGCPVSIVAGSVEPGLLSRLPRAVSEVLVVQPDDHSERDAMRQAAPLVEAAAARMAEGWPSQPLPMRSST